MELSRTFNEQMAQALQLEKAGRLSDAAAAYQKLFSKDPTSQQSLDRLLIVYRKQKDYRKELAVLNDAIAAIRQRQKNARDKWMQSHPQAARAGRSMLRQLEKGGDGTLGIGGAPPAIERLMKRKALVTAKITGRKTPKPKAIKPKTPVKKAETPKKSPPPKKVPVIPPDRAVAKERAAREKAARDRAAAAKDRAAAKQHAAAQKRAAAKAKQPPKPSLFIVILQYLVSLEKIDAAMKHHMVYLDKYYRSGNFLLSGRQVPRTGGIILAQAKTLKALKKIISQDPFIKRRLAKADIIEFTPSQSAIAPFAHPIPPMTHSNTRPA